MIPDQSGWKVSGSNSVIIGNLDKGDYTVASFTLQSTASSVPQTGGAQRNVTGNGGFPQRSASGSSSLMVSISYTNTMGNRESVVKTVSMSSSNLGSNNSTTSNYPTGPYGNFPGGRRTNSTPVLTYALCIIGAIWLILVFLGYMKYRREKTVNPRYRVTDLFKRKPKK
jgi:hypothetical protein